MINIAQMEERILHLEQQNNLLTSQLKETIETLNKQKHKTETNTNLLNKKLEEV